MEKLYTRQEAADILGIGVSKIDEERRGRRLAYIQSRPGGKVWISEKAIEEYLSRATHPALPEVRNVNYTYRKRRA